MEFDFIPNKVKMKINRSGKNTGEKGKRYVAVITGEVSFPGKYIQLIDTLYHAKKEIVL